ncbi:MAG TPA: phosphopantetheine-binding protein [Planctomycetaceae bacterium]|nr:phosphopantetheine-binding protein [Planctomycetaceae bacterium]
MDLRQKIEAVMRSVARQYHKTLIDEFRDDTVLLESGLDSLDCAIVIGRLQQELKIDPFSRLDDPADYPRTFGEFVRLYQSATGISS